MATIQTQKLKQKQRQRVAWLLSICVFVLLILSMYYIRIYFDNYQPMYEYGIEISYGEDQFGSGDQTVPIDDIITEPQPSESEATEIPEEELEAFEPNDAADAPLTQSSREDESQENEQPQPDKNQTDKRVQSEEGKDTQEGQGNDQDQEGNKGKETGINEEGLYDGAGGSGGPSLSVSGWRWSRPPRVNDDSDVTGTIVFEVVVDEFGDFVKVVLKSTNIANPVIVKKYENAVFKAILEPDNSGKTAPISKGTVTFDLKPKK